MNRHGSERIDYRYLVFGWIHSYLSLCNYCLGITTYKLYKASQGQAEALKELTKAILQLPSIAKHIQTQAELAEQGQKEREKVQRKALTG